MSATDLPHWCRHSTTSTRGKQGFLCRRQWAQLAFCSFSSLDFFSDIEIRSLFLIHYVLHANFSYFSYCLKKTLLAPKFQLLLTGSEEKINEALTLPILVYCCSWGCQSLSSMSPMLHLLEFRSSKHTIKHFIVLFTDQMLLLSDSPQFPWLRLDTKAKWWEIAWCMNPLCIAIPAGYTKDSPVYFVRWIKLMFVIYLLRA